MSQLAESPRLPKVLTTRDLTVLCILMILFMSNVGGVQYAGPAAFVYWALGIVTFLIPSAYVTWWLGRRFPGQCAPFSWASRVLGPNWSFFASFCAWIPGILAGIAVIQACIIYLQYLWPGLSNPFAQTVGIIALLGVATALALVPLRWLRQAFLGITALYVALFGVLALAGLWWLHARHVSAVDFSAPASWHLTGANSGTFGVVVLALLGIDGPLFLGREVAGERHQQRRAMRFAWWGVAIVSIAYIAGTFGIMTVLPADQGAALLGPAVMLGTVFGPLAATCGALILVAGHVAITVAYLLMFSRLLLLVAQHHRLPRTLTQVNQHGVPAASIITQGSILIGAALIALVIVPAFFSSLIAPANLSLIIYDVLLAACTLVWALSTLFLFVFALALQQRLRVARRARAIMAVMAALCGLASLLGTVQTLTNSWLPQMPDSAWSISVATVTAATLAAGWFFSVLPRMHGMLQEQRQLHAQEIALRQQLQRAYDELGRLYEEQARAAITDAVTGLPNHRALMGDLEAMLAGSATKQHACALLFADIDHFKQVNDTWGHRAGDALLREVASRLRSQMRAGDMIGRYGGEEFALCLAGPLDAAEALLCAERLRQAIAATPCHWADDGMDAPALIPMTISIGVALCPQHGDTRERLITAADEAMYRAKHAGRNRVCLAGPQRQREAQAA